MAYTANSAGVNDYSRAVIARERNRIHREINGRKKKDKEESPGEIENEASNGQFFPTSI